MSQTLFKLLVDKYGDNLLLDVFANGFLAGLISRMPEVNQVIINPFSHGKLKLIKRIILGLKLWNKRYDEAFILPNSFKSAIIPFFAGIKTRTGFLGEQRYFLLNNIYKLDKEKLSLMIDRFCAFANNGNKVDKISWPKLTVNLTNQEHLFQQFNVDLNKPIIAFCPGAEYGRAKRWPANHFAALADLLLENYGYQIIILGSSKDSEISKDIIGLVKKPHADIFDLCGKTNLVEVVDLLHKTKCVVTNDSGLMHIACAIECKVIAIYGSTSPSFTPPLANSAQVIQIKLECSPCFERTCRFGHYNCLNLITPKMVLAKII